MPRKTYIVIMAAGHGSRMGSATPKQFLPLGGKAILHRTVERFSTLFPDARFITVLPKEGIPLWKDYCLTRNFTLPQTVVAGGITRFHSVKNALGKIPDGALVAIHDGVRPLVSETLLQEMFARMEDVRALVPVVPCTDTLKVLRKGPDGVLEEVPGASVDRSAVWCAQTPQIFRSEDIKAAYQAPYDTAFTDDASVAATKGIPLSFIEGERDNLKITTPGDLVIAEAILRSASSN